MKGFILCWKDTLLSQCVALWQWLCFCPNVGECPRVCFSLISVVLVVVYQPGKWLWWCQLTPHCHSRFVSQPHCPHTPSLLATHHPSLLPPLPLHVFCSFFILILWCFQLILLFFDFFFLILMVYQWWWQMGFQYTVLLAVSD